MKAGMVLAGLLCVMHGAETRGPGGVESASREGYLQHLESCSEGELRRRLEFRFENNDALGAQEMMQSSGVYPRIRELGGYFAMAGMMLTDGASHRRYVEVFERSRLDAKQDVKMAKRLMGEMLTGWLWTEANEKLAEMATKKLKEKCGGSVGGEDEMRPNVVYHVVPEIGKWLWPAERRWGRVLGVFLRKDGVIAEVVEGEYNGELMKMMDGDEELADVLYCCVLRWRSMLDDLVDRNAVLAKKMVANVIEEGYWLYVDELEGVLEAERVRRLFSEDDMFGKIRAEYGVEGELSVAGLKGLAREGRLDRLVKKVIMRLVRYGQVNDLDWLLETVGRRVFYGLVVGGELDMALRKGLEKLVGHGKIDELKVLLETVGRRVFYGLLTKGELDAALKEGAERLIGRGWMNKLRMLIEAMEGRFEGLVSIGELDTALKQRAESLIRHGWTCKLKILMEVAGERFEGLVSTEQLDAVLKEATARLLRCGRVDDLKWLVEAMGGRFGVLAAGEGLDAVLKEGMEKLIRCGAVDELRKLLEIEVVKRRVSDGLVSPGELDMVFRGMVRCIMRSRGRDEVCTLKTALKERVFDGLVSREELSTASWKTVCAIA